MLAGEKTTPFVASPRSVSLSIRLYRSMPNELIDAAWDFAAPTSAGARFTEAIASS